MVVVVLGQAMLRDLLEDDNERVDQVLEVARSLLDLVEVIVERGGHDTRVTVAECALHMRVECLNWLNVVKADKHHDGFLPDHLLRVLHQSKHYVLNGGNNASMAQLGDDV